MRILVYSRSPLGCSYFNNSADWSLQNMIPRHIRLKGLLPKSLTGGVKVKLYRGLCWGRLLVNKKEECYDFQREKKRGEGVMKKIITREAVPLNIPTIPLTQPYLKNKEKKNLTISFCSWRDVIVRKIRGLFSLPLRRDQKPRAAHVKGIMSRDVLFLKIITVLSLRALSFTRLFKAEFLLDSAYR